MKKFLSLVLALVMTMSLVTIGAGATEYKDLSDKDEIQYEEAVAVLNKIGVITGYTDGSFQPTGSLTRGAAAKIIVSMMIGPEAASALTVTAAPYKDVPVTNTFAAVISYCKTQGYINGYSDNTFRPTAPLTGFAFAKMLLGALGYDGKVEGFSGSGWTMNVASLGNVAGLYNDFVDTFKGNDGVTREQACQLALNTLKATQVEYVGGTSVTAGDASVTINPQRQYKTSNDGKINKNINDKKTDSNSSDYYTLEFGEEHFRDLKLLGDTTTDFNRPATQWSYKNVTIGKFAVTPDFVFTAAPSGDTAKDKVKDLGLNNYKVADSAASGSNVVNHEKTHVSINDDEYSNYFGVAGTLTSTTDTERVAQKLVDLFGNGIVVEVYLDDDTADLISDIVVIRSQLMEVNTASSKTITVKQLDEVGNIADKDKTGTDPVYGGKYFKNISSIKDGDDAYNDLKSSKTGDYMLVTYTGSNATKEAFSAVAPTVVTGALTSVSRNSSNVVNSVTVGGTEYKLAAIRDDDFASLTAKDISNTKKDVTLYLDAYGYATYIKDAGTSSSYMVYGDNYSTLVNGKLVQTMTGWDMKGNEVEINVGTNGIPNTVRYGDLLKYTSTSSNNADYAIVTNGTQNWVDANNDGANDTANAKGIALMDVSADLSASDVTVKTQASTQKLYIASGVKIIYLDFNGGSTVDSVYVRDGMANISKEDLGATVSAPAVQVSNAQVYINDKNAVEAIVVKTTSSDAISNNVMYIEYVKSSGINGDGNRTYTYNVWRDGVEDEVTSTDSIDAGRFVTYVENANGNYKLSEVKAFNSATSSFRLQLTKDNINQANKNLVYAINAATPGMAAVSTASLNKIESDTWGTMGVKGSGDLYNNKTELNLGNAVWTDLTDNGFSSLKDVFESDLVTGNIYLTIIVNNKTGDNELKVTQVVVNSVTTAPLF